MAGLNDLVTAISGAVGIPEPTVFAYGRFAREAGFIFQKGRGRSAASMSLRDAANLLIAVSGTDVTREAGNAIKQFRSMPGRLYSFSGSLAPIFLEWWRPLGIKEVGQSEFGKDYELVADFGGTVEHLIRSTIDGSLVELFRQIPVAEIPHDVWADWRRSKSLNLHYSVDLLVERGLVQPKPAADLQFGEDITLNIAFDRSEPSVDVEFCRMWDNPETLFVASFSRKKKARWRRLHDLRLVATLTQHTLAAVALVLCGLAKPAAIRSYRPMDFLFEQQFKRLWQLPRSADLALTGS